jgi:hypothetical protein
MVNLSIKYFTYLFAVSAYIFRGILCGKNTLLMNNGKKGCSG